MRLKTDENIHPEVAVALRRRGHDALTVWDQGMRGAPDDDLFAICANESRVLLTLDLDFADIRHYPPRQCAGIIVFRLAKQSRSQLLARVESVFWFVETRLEPGDLWIISDASIRVRRD
ncbi:MAG: DUF5615 family PIN-like protein [Phycisphaerae bacterium]|nr:DUF5615 family PIN-like protein [Phycisphaerae bacterium]